MTKEIDKEIDCMSTQLLNEIKNIKTVQELADFFCITSKELNYLLYSRAFRYRTFNIPKNNGEHRIIESPPQRILLLQRKIASYLFQIYKPKISTHGFCKNRSIVTNANSHINKGEILSIDLKDFFHQIHFGRIYGIFKSPPFSLPHEPSTVLARICCWGGRLPQGGATSPIISNYICRRLDRELYQYCKKLNCVYTRYADDITISSKKNQKLPHGIVLPGLKNRLILNRALTEIFDKNQLIINPEKTRISNKRERQNVTGIIVNHRANVPREYIREIRAIIHSWETKGYATANSDFLAKYENKSNLSSYLIGKISHLKHVRGEQDRLYIKYALRVARLVGSINSSSSLKINVSSPFTEIKDLLQHALFIIKIEDQNGTLISNGTAFHTDEGTFSSYHVVKPDIKKLIENDDLEKGDKIFISAIRVSEPGSTYQVEIEKHCSHIDIAKIKIKTNHYAYFSCGKYLPELGSKLSILGFPEWSSSMTGFHGQASVATRKTISAVEMIQIDRNIYGGNSGGPVLDSKGQVIGLVKYGLDGAIYKNSAVSSKHFNI